MTDLVQLNLSVDGDLRDTVDRLAVRRGSTKREVITTAVYALAQLSERLELLIRESASVEEDLGDLIREVAHLMPFPLIAAKIGWGRLSDGRVALIVDDEWWIARDPNGDLMAIRPDGGQVGYISRGRIEALADLVVEGEIKTLQEPSVEVTLN